MDEKAKMVTHCGQNIKHIGPSPPQTQITIQSLPVPPTQTQTGYSLLPQDASIHGNTLMIQHLVDQAVSLTPFKLIWVLFPILSLNLSVARCTF